MTERNRDKWCSWMTRITHERNDRLLKLGKILVQNHKIPKNDKYHIARFALMALEETLFKQFVNSQKKESKSVIEEDS